MNLLQQHYADIDTCLIVVERVSGLIIDSFGSPALPLGEAVRQRHWQDVLGAPEGGSAVVTQALNAVSATALPPIVVRCEGQRECVVGGMLVPQPWQGRDCALLFLRKLLSPLAPELEAAIDEGDIVAVVGVHLLEFSPSWGADETEQLMMDLRSGMQQILREEDSLGLPEGATITAVLRAIEPEQALNISRALLSHLHQRLGGREGGAQYARACVGLSQCAPGQSAVTALVAANSALLQAQAGGEERIRFSSPWDPQALAARSLNASGAFRDGAIDRARRNYLQTLVDLPFRPDSDYAEAVVRHTLEQHGLQSAALLREAASGDLEVLAAAVLAAGKVRCSAAGKVPKVLQGTLRRLEKQGLEAALQLTEAGLALLPLTGVRMTWGYLLLLDRDPLSEGFRPSSAALQFIGPRLQAALDVAASSSASANQLPAEAMEKGIEGYVLDNMEGAIDQAAFLAKVEMPVAIIGEQGTGKMYVARIVHNEAGGEPDALVRIDCSELRTRAGAWPRILHHLSRGQARTLVFKAPHLLHPELQGRLARVLATRTVSEERGASRYIARNRFIAVLPMEPATLVQRGELHPRLASVFAGFPIIVPPLRERRRAVLRWAHKILEQESAASDRRMLGFTPDAERALREHDWPGNISEMRHTIHQALTRTDKEWLTPVDLGLFLGISPDGRAAVSRERPFLEMLQERREPPPQYASSPQDELRMALGQALVTSVATGVLRPIGQWLEDEIIDAAYTRCGEDSRRTAAFLHTRPRNVSRWLPRVRERQPERDGSLLWQEACALVRQWIAEFESPEQSPQAVAEDMLLSLILQHNEELSVVERAQIMGVSAPTYHKRLRRHLEAQ